MVKVREDYHPKSAGDIDLRAWTARLGLDESTVSPDHLLKAFEMSLAFDTPEADKGPQLANSSFFTGLEMVEILADLRLDEAALLAAALYRPVRESRLPLSTVQASFGDEVAELIDGVQRMAAISMVNTGADKAVLGQQEAQSETIRKMLVALVDDVRVALIKLAERTCAIRAVKDKPAKRYRVAREVFDIYAPLAHRLGIGHIKWELEDLSFRYLQPQIYKKIAKLLDEKRLDRQKYIESLIERLRSDLAASDIDAEVMGRAKHIYSIWRKMQRKGIGFSQVYDIRAIRVMVPSVRDCYAALGVVHGQWRNIPNEFDDYIASPKENGYRSLHTAVIGPEGKVLEVQIRTRDMHEEAEFGVCAHWAYKGADRTEQQPSSYDRKISWLRQFLDWHEDQDGSETLVEQFESAQERVYVFTPEGHVVNLPNGATPLDFAYHIHTEIGHRCRGAKVNGRIVPLSYQLLTGDRVEVLTGKESEPRRDWLQTGVGYIRTARARAKVQHWFRLQAKEDNINAGRALLEKEFRRLALSAIDYKLIADKLSCRSVDDMYAAVGSGEISLEQTIRVAHTLTGDSDQVRIKLVNRPDEPAQNGVRVSGVGNLLTHFAGCCKPLPGDPIAGYITVGRGVSVHREDCKKLLQLQSQEPERIVAVNWTSEQASRYPVDIEIEAWDRSGLLRDITHTLTNARVDVMSMNTETDEQAHRARIRLRAEMADLSQLGRLFSQLQSLPNIEHVRRIRDN